MEYINYYQDFIAFGWGNPEYGGGMRNQLGTLVRRKTVRGTRTYDCFNLVSVDASLHLLKIVRVGDNADHYLRIKRVLCYDYIKEKVIFNN